MEGPTPVSALIHAATMVTAGVFLVIRCSPVFEYAPEVLTIVTFIGASTSLFAATIALTQNDIKKVIAYSTCSQLGYMVFGCGFSNYAGSFFHLLNHAFFKALLFLSAGAIIHSLSGEQDIRKMGGLVQVMPFTYVMMLIGSLSLAGFPFLSGYYSKDAILEVALAHYTVTGQFIFFVGTLTALLTAFYSLRLLVLVFFVDYTGYKSVISKALEVDGFMAFSLSILAVGSLFSGYVAKDMFLGLGSDFFKQSVFTLPENLKLTDAEFLPISLKMIPVKWSLFGCTLGFILCQYFDILLANLKFKLYLKPLYIFLVRN